MQSRRRGQGTQNQARREREALGPLETPELETVRQALEAAQTDLSAARDAVEAALAESAAPAASGPVWKAGAWR